MSEKKPFSINSLRKIQKNQESSILDDKTEIELDALNIKRKKRDLYRDGSKPSPKSEELSLGKETLDKISEIASEKYNNLKK